MGFNNYRYIKSVNIFHVELLLYKRTCLDVKHPDAKLRFYVLYK